MPISQKAHKAERNQGRAGQEAKTQKRKEPQK